VVFWYLKEPIRKMGTNFISGLVEIEGGVMVLSYKRGDLDCI